MTDMIATVDQLIEALLAAQEATEPVTLLLTSENYDLSSSSIERDERFGSGLLESALPHITKNVTIDIAANPELQNVRVYQESPVYRLFYVAEGASLTLKHLELAYGDVGALDTGGGAIFNDGTLTVQNCQLHNNKSNYGGAILNMHGQTNISNCDIFDNEADWGGGLYNSSVANGCIMTVTDSRIAHNLSCQTWAVGGGIANFGALTVIHCMITRNEASKGGGIANWATDAQATIQYSHITYNDGSNSGGGILNDTGFLQVDCSTLVKNTSPLGKQVNKTNGSLILGKVSLPDGYTTADVPAGITVTSYRPYWIPEFIMERQVSTKKLIPTYLYDTDQRKQLSKFAVQAAQHNFDTFATTLSGNNLGSGTEQTSDHDTSSVGGRIKYSVANVLSHISSSSATQNSTGSSTFVSEMLNLGGAIPMVKAIDGDAACPGSFTDPVIDNGWRACIDANGRANSATEVWKSHDQIVNYFEAVRDDYNYDEEEAQNNYSAAVLTFAAVNGDHRLNLTTFAGTLDTQVGTLQQFQDKLYTIFNDREDLAVIQTGDYVFLNLGQQGVTHGLLIVGWGPAVECPKGLNSPEVGFADPYRTTGEYQVSRKAGTVPYVVDLAYSYNSAEDKTGWFEDPRPRPFYCTAVLIGVTDPDNTDQMNPVLSRLGSFSTFADYMAKLRNRYQPFRIAPDDVLNPNWKFVHIPNKVPATNGVLLACV